ncbi:hypothetical protein N7462_003916 [Penicillium macrosclerotiorum]|uniref:uncharacterized protein n=1 Tax=Penicillium macrosclerotiorum TaxID=303699 RepID=UPI0025478371|nr:uncharacterized protein N7462_003916 [Penicillium macrosclerotiorum]KAJ5689524.1 hypothetical protein N7462_003916 [Penicillium macrosclerotiorum]
MMAQKIPSSLVTISQISSEGVHGHETLDGTAIKTLWQVFLASRKASHNDMDERMEYLFWRIWSSRALLASLDVQTLSHLVSRITQSPENMHLKMITISPTPKMPSSHQIRAHSPAKPRSIKKPKDALHPILKKPKSLPNQSHKTTRLLLEKPGDGSITRNPSNPPSPSSPDVAPKEDSTVRQPQKKAYFTANRPGRGARRRPVFNRRRSSQMNVTKALSPPSLQQAQSDSPDIFDLISDDEGSSPATQPQPTHHGSLDIEAPWIDLDQFELTAPVSPQPNSLVAAPLETGLVTTHPHRPRLSEEPSPALPMSEKRDPILSQGIETVSLGSSPHDQNQCAKPMDSSCSEPSESFVEGTDVPGFPGAKRVPMPISMKRKLVDILTTSKSPQGSPPAFLSYVMTTQESSPLVDQPSDRPLVLKGFRERFAQVLKESRCGEETTPALPGISAALEEEKEI